MFARRAKPSSERVSVALRSYLVDQDQCRLALVVLSLAASSDGSA